MATHSADELQHRPCLNVRFWWIFPRWVDYGDCANHLWAQLFQRAEKRQVHGFMSFGIGRSWEDIINW